MGVLMKEYAGYMAIALIGAAFLKIILTNLCIQFGLKGGHFFPVIFAGVCLGYGLAMLFFGQQGDGHVVFAAAIVTSGRYHEEAAGGDHAFVPVFSGENIYMDIYCSSSGK